jgi:hypothetical protein
VAAAVVVQHKQQMAALAVRVHSPVAVVVQVGPHARAFLVALVALVQQDIVRFTHGKQLWRDRRWRCR